MTLNTYAGLQDAIAGWLNRQDQTARIPDFISLCEAKLRRRVKHDVGLSNVITFDLANNTFPLPDDFSGVMFLTSSDTTQPALVFVPPADFMSQPLTDPFLAPSRYTILGQKIMVDGYVGGLGFTLGYRTKIDLASLGGNWILDNHYDLYLFGSLVAAEPYIVEDDRVALWKGQFDEALAEVNRDGQSQQFGSQLLLKPGWIPNHV